MYSFSSKKTVQVAKKDGVLKIGTKNYKESELTNYYSRDISDRETYEVVFEVNGKYHYLKHTMKDSENIDEINERYNDIFTGATHVDDMITGHVKKGLCEIYFLENEKLLIYGEPIIEPPDAVILQRFGSTKTFDLILYFEDHSRRMISSIQKKHSAEIYEYFSTVLNAGPDQAPINMIEDAKRDGESWESIDKALTGESSDDEEWVPDSGESSDSDSECDLKRARFNSLYTQCSDTDAKRPRLFSTSEDERV